MNFTSLRTYAKFLSRHKVYTFVSVAGFAISLTFVIILSVYAKTQVSMDSFHEKKDRIYLLARDDAASNSSPVAEYVQNLLPEVESFTRVISLRNSIGKSEREWSDGMVMFADRDFFNIFSFPLLEGSTSQVLAVDKSAVVSRGTALKLFGGEDPIGKPLYVMGHEVLVTGIMEDFPYETHFEAPDVILPYPLLREIWGNHVLDHWGTCNYCIYFLAREGADLPSKSGLLLEKFREDYGIFRGGFSNVVRFMPLEDIYFSGIPVYNIRTKSGSLNATRIYFSLALLILIISVLNYVNMTMAQAGFRGKEAAVKKLMGSGKGKIVRQLLVESLLMTTAALLLALLFALLSERYFNGLLGTRLDIAGTLATPGAIAVVAGLLLLISAVSGIIPALAVSSFRPIEVVKGSFKRRVKTGYAKVLIIFQFAVCTVLLICTLLMGRQASYMMNYDIGFNRDNIMMMENVADLDHDQLQSARERLLSLPGVEAVGFAAGSPLNGGNNNSFEMDGRPVSIQILSGDEAYFDIFGFRVTPVTDVKASDGDFVYVNRAGFNELRPDSSTYAVNGWWRDIVVTGIFDDININSLHSPVGPAMFYYMGDQDHIWEIVVKMSGADVFETAERVRREYSDISGGAFFNWYFADSQIEGWYENERRMTGIMGAFTLLSIVIMVMGVFAMSLYMIRQKQKEIGVRKVSGATVGEILGMLNLQSLSRVGIAFLIACPVAYYGISRWLEGFAYRIEPRAGAFILAGIIVTLLCLASVSWQTLRAARANPVDSLKSE